MNINYKKKNLRIIIFSYEFGGLVLSKFKRLRSFNIVSYKLRNINICHKGLNTCNLPIQDSHRLNFHINQISSEHISPIVYTPIILNRKKNNAIYERMLGGKNQNNPLVYCSPQWDRGSSPRFIEQITCGTAIWFHNRII